jgi:hypothetical protein
MDFGDSVIELHDADGATLFSAKLGRSITGGGRFVQFNNEEKAYLVSLSSWLDTTAKNWADTALVPAKAEDVTRFEIGFDSDEPLVVTRTSSSDPWTAEGLPDGGALNSDAVAKLVNQLAGLRFTETIAVDSPDVDVARKHVRKFVLQTAEGTSYNIQIGQVPPPPPPPATEEPEPDSGEAKPKPEPKPGPVFVFVQSPEAGSEFNERMSRVGYQINEWTYKGMPDNRSAFITIAPPAPTPQPAVTPPDSLPAPTMPTSTPPTPEAEAAGEVETGTTSE